MRFRIALMSVVAGILGLVAVAPASGSGGGGARVTVKPKVGMPNSRFVVSFTAQDTTGSRGGIMRNYVVSATGGSASGSCGEAVTASVPPGHAHTRVHVMLAPGAKRWCLGTYHGAVKEYERPVCPRGPKVCPLFVVMMKNVGKFTFRVRASTVAR